MEFGLRRQLIACRGEPVYTNPTMAAALNVSESETVKSLVVMTKEKVGCEVGCVPPFGQITDLPIFMDPDLAKKDSVYFNPGVHDKSYKTKAWDLKKMCSPRLG